MKETILIIIFISIIFVFYLITKNEVQLCEAFNGEVFLCRDLPDKKDAANLIATIKNRLYKLINICLHQCDENHFLNNYINTIKRKWNNIEFKETTADSEFTSYSINKGEFIVMCLRQKGGKNHNKLHDINELMYVAIHELAHVGCPEIGHTPLFKKINHNLLEIAEKTTKKSLNCKKSKLCDCEDHRKGGLKKAIIYHYRDYDTYPEPYCGIHIDTTILN